MFRGRPIYLMGGYHFLFGHFFLSAYLRKTFLSLTWAEKIYSESTLCLKKTGVFFKKKNNVVSSWCKARQKYFDSETKP